MTAKPPLKAYQRENVEWLRRVQRGLLADEPGLGKSRSALEAYAGAGRVLIIAPKLVIETGMWHEEVERWGVDDTKYYVAPYSGLNRRVKTGKTASSTRPVKALDEEWRGSWDAVILDEAHYIKGRDTKWTWAADQISKKAGALAMLTGTPIPNWAHEVFNLLRMLNPEEAHPGRKYGSFWRWAEEWFDCSPTRFSNGNPVVGDLLGCTPRCLSRDANDPCHHYEAFARENFGDQYMRHLREDHLDLPPIEFIDTPTPLGKDDRRSYTQLKHDFATTIDGHEALAWSQGAKNVMLDKFTTSPWLLHKQGPPRGGKFEYVRERVANATEPMLLFAHYRDSVDGLGEVARSVGATAGTVHGGNTDMQNARQIRDFKAGKIDVLVGSLETMAEALTLTIANKAIFVERSYKPSRNTQATYRIYRLGQEKACTIERLITSRTVDSGKEKLLNTKTDRQMRTLTAADFLRIA